jgi:hypothetical protein
MRGGAAKLVARLRLVGYRLESLAYELLALARNAVRRARANVTTDLAEVNPAAAPGRQLVVTARTDELRWVPERLRALRVERHPLRVTTEAGAIYVPTSPIARFWDGGLYTEDGKLIPSTALFRDPDGSEQVTRERPEGRRPEGDLGGPAIYAGSLLPHFGHFTTEALARLWYAVEQRPDLPIVWHGPGALQVPHVRFILSTLGVADRTLTISRPTRIHEVHVPEPTMILRGPIHERHVALTREVATRVLGSDVPEPTEQPLYFSRAGLSPELRSMNGEHQLMRHLRDAGVKVVHPGELDDAEKIRLVNRHAVIVGPIGSAHLWSLFALEPRHVVYLCPAVRAVSVQVDLVAGHRAHHVQVAPMVPSMRKAGRQVLDLPQALSALREIGVLSSRPKRPVRVDAA